MPLISVITPVYNSEKYLEQCLYSILTQTLRDIEVILIDDGSTDSSPEICDKYAELDNRIKVIHKENAGLGVSYNIGIDNAKGEYIGFIESDDFADKNMYADLYIIAEKFNTDIVKSSWYQYYTNTDKAFKDIQLNGYNSGENFKINKHPEMLKIQFSVWSAIYRTEYLRKNNIRYLETPGASYQDVAFTYKAFCLADSMVVTPNAYIYYRQDNENASVKSKEKSEVIFVEYAEVDRFFSENPDIKIWANDNKLVKQFYDYKWNYYRIKDDLKSHFIKRAADDFNKYKRNNELTKNFYTYIYRDEFKNLLNLV